MARYLFRNAQILDAGLGEYLPESSVLVEGDRILEVGVADVQASQVQSFDRAGMAIFAARAGRRMISVTAAWLGPSSAMVWMKYARQPARKSDVVPPISNSC